MPNTLQSFYVDPAALQNADNVGITSVDLYFKSKPNPTTNETGIVNPGVTVGICQFDTNTGVITTLSTTRKTYDSIYSSSTSDAVTTCSFDSPVFVQTGKTYGIVVYPEDGGYDLWVNKGGDKVTGTNTPSGGPTTNSQGQLFVFTGSTLSNQQTNTQLKFAVSVAQFIDTSVTIDMVNQPYEFLNITNRYNAFTGGENVFANTATLTGTVATTANSTIITGSGTQFTQLASGQKIVVTSGQISQVVNVRSVANDTYLTLTTPLTFTNTVSQYRYGIVGSVISVDYVNGQVVLNNSNANSTAKFIAGLTITGEHSQATAVIQSVVNLPVDKFVAHIDATTTTSGTLSSTYNLSYSNGSSFIVGGSYQPLVSGDDVPADDKQHYIISRSNEVSQPYLYTNNKSAITKVTLTTSNPYAAPVLNNRNTDIIVYQNQISNTYTRAYANGISYDSEVLFNGTAKSKLITKKMTFDGGKKAEDLVVYASAFRPANTHIRWYARLYNSEDSDAFDDKFWTPLSYKSNSNVRSSVDKHDYIEYQLGLPQYPRSQFTADGKFTTTANSTIIAVTGGTTGQLVAGQAIKIYNELFPTNYLVTTVSSANATNVVVQQSIDYPGITGTGQKIDVLDFNQTAFNNQLNYNICRYFNSVGAAFDTFNTVQVKAVLLADNTNIVPEIDQLEVIGVSA